MAGRGLSKVGWCATAATRAATSGMARVHVDRRLLGKMRLTGGLLASAPGVSCRGPRACLQRGARKVPAAHDTRAGSIVLDGKPLKDARVDLVSSAGRLVASLPLCHL